MDPRIQSTWDRCQQAIPQSNTLPALKESLFYLWECSRYCLNICERYPEESMRTLLHVASSESPGALPKLQCESLQELLADVSEFSQAQHILRKARHLDFLSLCWLDLVANTPISTVLTLQSRVADCALVAAEQWLRGHLCEQLGYACRSEAASSEPMAVIALGKLGGQDLNFSSDIDLIFCHGDQLQYVGKRSWTVHKYYLELGRKLVSLIGQVTADGFCFRVDLRLRPFGDSGPLVVSIDQLEDYLQAHGREWERYAFIKSRVVTGAQQQRSDIESVVRPFVYRKYIDFSVIESLRNMKAMIEQQVQRRQLHNNIKLGRGGIREIEFIVQVIQLIRGGQDPALQLYSLLQTLAVIERRRYLHAEDIEVLRDAYAFMRRLENHLQMQNEQQVHELPASLQVCTQMAKSMSLQNADELSQKLATTQDKVHRMFAQLLAERNEQKSRAEQPQLNVASLEDLMTHQSEYAAQLACPQAQELIEQLGVLVQSAAYRQQDDIGRSRLNRFIVVLLPAVGATAQPAQTMQRLIPLLRNVLRRSSYLVLLVENPSALDALVQLVAGSPWIAQHFAAYPILLDDLLTDLNEDECLSKQVLLEQMISETGMQGQCTYEEILDRIRQFKHSQLLRVARASVTGKLTVMQVSDQLSWITESIISGCLGYLRDQYASVFDTFGIIAFGKLGGIEMSYASDLDLVFVYQPPADGRTVDPSGHIRLAQKLSQMLSLQTVSGKLYEVDVRLRPHGASGPVVSSIEYMHTYYKNDAWTWEYQALVRARMIEGSEALRSRFNEIRGDILCQRRDQHQLATEVCDMRNKMLKGRHPSPEGYFDLKSDRGGITDIEFMVQYEVLANAFRFPAVAEFTDNFRQLESLSRLELLPADKIMQLTSIYLQYRSRSHQLALQAVDTQLSTGEFAAERKFVKACWDEIFASVDQ